jgi:hypothetical protein
MKPYWSVRFDMPSSLFFLAKKMQALKPFDLTDPVAGCSFFCAVNGRTNPCCFQEADALVPHAGMWNSDCM